MNRYYKQQKGFALLLGVVVSAILVSITYTMFSVSLKQIELSTVGKNSQIALYAADMGLECALYEDTKKDEAFAKVTTSGSGSNVSISINPTGTQSFTCNGSTKNYNPANCNSAQMSCIVNGVDHPEAIVTTFSFNAGPNNPACAEVKVVKYIDSQNTLLMTHIESRGYNTCNTSDPLRLERGLEVNY